MSRKRPTADRIGELLSQPHFRRDAGESSDAPASNSPAATTPMLVDVDKLVPYDRNPRRTPNDKYDELKAYISDAGFNQVLTITQRPDTDRPDTYMIGVGGNTRLLIVQELWKETADERFRQVWCQFQPWTGETHTLVSHIQDNDLRGDLTFIDRALAVQDLRGLLEEEAGKPLSQRELRDRLGAAGYPISRTMIGWYDYTVDTLYPLIPHVLQTGVGRTTITKVYELQRAFSKAWASMDLGAADEAVGLFEQTLQRHDGDGLDFDALRRDLEEELSVSADCDMQRASLELGAALYGRSDSEADRSPIPGHPAPDPDLAGDDSGVQPTPAPASAHRTPGAPADRTSAPPLANTPPSQAPLPASGAAVRPAGREGHAASTSARPADNDRSKPREPSPDPEPTNPPGDDRPTARDSIPGDLKSLRARAWTLASRIAQGSRLGEIVTPIRGGLGFLVGPVPMDAQQAWHPEIGRSAMCVWWHLATLAEQFARHGQACAYMPQDWQRRRIGDAMRQARDGPQAFSRWQWEQADRELLCEVPPLEPNDIGPMLYQSWPDQRWNDWVQLVETYRAIYRFTDNKPWEG